MKKLEQHNKEIESFVKEKLTYGGYGDHLDDTMSMDYAVKLIQSQNKQLYIKIAEGEIERTIQLLKYDPIPTQAKYENENYYNGAVFSYQKHLKEELTHWQNILTELNK